VLGFKTQEEVMTLACRSCWMSSILSKSKRAAEAMLQMKKIDTGAMEKATRFS
jgi:hypothetical protein